jgi:hypothetical protein
MTSKTTLLNAFNDNLIGLLNDIITVFPSNTDIAQTKNYMVMIRKANPKLLVQIWNSYVVGKYKGEIESGNIDFFVNKDYSEDLAYTKYAARIVEGIDRLREPVKQMTAEDQAKTMTYIQNLTKLGELYDL